MFSNLDFFPLGEPPPIYEEFETQHSQCQHLHHQSVHTCDKDTASWTVNKNLWWSRLSAYKTDAKESLVNLGHIIPCCGKRSVFLFYFTLYEESSILLKLFFSHTFYCENWMLITCRSDVMLLLLQLSVDTINESVSGIQILIYSRCLLTTTSKCQADSVQWLTSSVNGDICGIIMQLQLMCVIVVCTKIIHETPWRSFCSHNDTAKVVQYISVIELF